MAGRRRGALAAVAVALSLRLAAGSEPPGAVGILFISSLDLSSPETNELIDSLKAAVAGTGRRVEVFPESLDLYRLPPIAEYSGVFQEHLAARYGGRRIDVIVAQASQASQAAVLYRDVHAPGTPVLCIDMIDAGLAERLSSAPEVYGRPMGGTLEQNVRLAARLFPASRTIYLFVTINIPSYLPGFYEVFESIRAEMPRVDLRLSMNASLDEVESILASAEEGSVAILQPGSWKLPSGEAITGTELVDRLSKLRPLPYFSGNAALFGGGLVGGSFGDRSRMGREAGETIVSILFSERPPEAWRESSSLRDSVDYRALRRFSILLSRVPGDAKVVNRPPSFWISHEGPLKMLGLALVASVLALLAWSLVRRREERILRESNERLELTVERRTEELRTANARLEASNESLRLSLRRIEGMQERIVEETRDMVLGRIALGLAHEINNPLAAIVASLHTLTEFISGGERDLLSFISGLDEEGAALFFDSLGRWRRAYSPGGGEERERRAVLERRLASLGVSRPGSEARDLVDALLESALDDVGDADLARLCAPENRTVLEALHRASVFESGVSISNTAVARIAETVESMRSYARDFEDGFAGEGASVGDTIDRALSLFKEQAAKGVEVVRSLEEGLPPVAASDAGLVRIWVNLAGNAIQAMGGVGRLEFAARREGAFAVVEVVDSGPGVPPELEGRLFTPFATTNDIDRGMGLGLSICRRIAEGCGGTISQSGRPGRTVFSVRLPLAGGGA